MEKRIKSVLRFYFSLSPISPFLLFTSSFDLFRFGRGGIMELILL